MLESAELRGLRTRRHSWSPLKPGCNSYPQIAAAVNGLAATGARLTLEGPVGPYLDRLEAAGMGLPEGVDLSDCWIVERGDADHLVRARFQLPAGAGPISEVTVNGAPVRSGAQLADRVVVRIGAIPHSAGSQDPRVKDCES